jgi:hypothetical protein
MWMGHSLVQLGVVVTLSHGVALMIEAVTVPRVPGPRFLARTVALSEERDSDPDSRTKAGATLKRAAPLLTFKVTGSGDTSARPCGSVTRSRAV